ncbi:MAG: chromophore lyase CpcT/CpeT [Candidatus Sumerlaeia bacterium]|nr:chromophore lyase CpcT/CpeT [Candidatus Sumerlaeia bacterium]
MIHRTTTAAAILCASALSLTGCAGVAKSSGPGGDLDTLMEWMEGDFDNKPSVADPAKQAIEEHFAIQVSLRRVPRLDSVDGKRRALYIEQASAATPARPYRQRVYFVYQTSRREFVSEVWELEDAALYRNAHLDPSLLAQLTPDQLDKKEGCEVYLRWNGSAFVGGTREKNCPSELAGASYATSEVTVTANGFTSWDRGFDAMDIQVWGAAVRPYEFTSRATP